MQLTLSNYLNDNTEKFKRYNIIIYRFIDETIMNETIMSFKKHCVEPIKIGIIVFAGSCSRLHSKKHAILPMKRRNIDTWIIEYVTRPFWDITVNDSDNSRVIFKNVFSRNDCFSWLLVFYSIFESYFLKFYKFVKMDVHNDITLIIFDILHGDFVLLKACKSSDYLTFNIK